MNRLAAATLVFVACAAPPVQAQKISPYAPIAVPEQRFAACLVPLVLLGLIPVIFTRRFGKVDAGTGTDTPGFRVRRKSALTFLANRGLAGRRARLSVPLYLVVGPPGVGKTTLARLIARMTHCEFVPFSAVLSGIKEITRSMAEKGFAYDPRGSSGPCVLFSRNEDPREYEEDEVHAFQ